MHLKMTICISFINLKGNHFSSLVSECASNNLKFLSPTKKHKQETKTVRMTERQRTDNWAEKKTNRWVKWMHKVGTARIEEPDTLYILNNRPVPSH